ncbi:MAG: sulfate ABC transporter permease subunit CysT [Planctomycetota bacterium]
MTATKARRRGRRGVLPGFRLALGLTLLYFSLIILVPLGALVLRAAQMSPGAFWRAVSGAEVLASYRLSFGAAAAGAAVNVVFGSLVAWVLVRYEFPARRLVDALVDLPFALPTAVAGLTLTSLYVPGGWLGRWLEPLGVKVAYAPLGVVVALTFVGLPFVVRTVQPVLEDLDAEVEEAAASLGAARWQTIRRVILPELAPALATGFALAFARALGEYGSVVFISGNLPFRTQITPHAIYARLEGYDYAGATAIAVVMLAASFVLLLTINGLQRWATRRAPAYGD